MTRLPDEALRGIFVPMGCVGALSTSNVMMQQICFDEIIYQMGLDEKTAARAWEYIREGRLLLPAGLDAIIAGGVKRLERMSATAVKSAFSIVTGILFYDEFLSVAERRLFYDLSRRFGLSKYHADMVFSAHLSVFSMKYDQTIGVYRYQESSSGAETASAESTERTESAGGNAGSAGAADEADIREQMRQEALRRQEMRRQQFEAEARRQERMRRQEKAREDETKRRQAEFRRQQEESRRRFREEQKRREESFRQAQEEESGRRQEESRREQEERQREQESSQKRRRWWWNRTDDAPDDGDMSLAEAYRTLQCGRDDSDEAVRQAWRRLVGRYHPDRAASRGADQEEIARFNAIAARINAAWDVVRKERKL